MANDIQVYGTEWCGLTFGVRKYLMDLRLAHEFCDIDRDAGAEDFVRATNDGRRRFPIVVVEEEVLTQPTVAVLQRVLDEHRIGPAAPRRRTDIPPPRAHHLA